MIQALLDSSEDGTGDEASRFAITRFYLELSALLKTTRAKRTKNLTMGTALRNQKDTLNYHDRTFETKLYPNRQLTHKLKTPGRLIKEKHAARHWLTDMVCFGYSPNFPLGE
jgi:hypothetical protein